MDTACPGSGAMVALRGLIHDGIGIAFAQTEAEIAIINHANWIIYSGTLGAVEVPQRPKSAVRHRADH